MNEPASNDAAPPLPDDRDWVALWTEMVRIRAFENRVQALFRAGRVPGLTHLCTGQEAVAVGACAALRAGDWIASTHRGHGHSLAKGSDPRAMLAEIMGKETGICGGRGGSMHIFDAAAGNLGTNGIVGGGVPLATGAALTAKRTKSGAVALAFFGDGALNQGVVLECFNMAAIWKLPVVFVCEHNGYGEFTASDDVTAGDIQDRIAAFGMPVEDIDGMDLPTVVASAEQAVAEARADNGPRTIIARAWRFTGHHAGDDESYKDDAETREWRARDPIPRLRRRLLAAGHAASQLDRVVSESESEMATIAKLAAEDRPGTGAQASTGVFA